MKVAILIFISGQDRLVNIFKEGVTCIIVRNQSLNLYFVQSNEIGILV